MLIEARPATDPELQTLLLAGQQELNAVDGERDRAVFTLHDDVAYLVVVVQGRAVACGGWQALGPGSAELKRMYVRPAHRNRGIARQLIVALEEEALASGRPLLRLAAGASLPAAVALCRSAGYERIPAYGEHTADPYSVCFEKSLVAVAH